MDVPQIIGEIRGRELPGQVVVLGGQLGSWQPCTGAQDTGSGTDCRNGAIEQRAWISARAKSSSNEPATREQDRSRIQ